MKKRMIRTGKMQYFFVLHKIIIAVLMELYRHYAIIIAEMHKEYCAFLLSLLL